ncbi:hypothetical protein CBM2604_B40200 [Cupriavidus taiwanensis]|nr:hypothetical protein CBM2604_B40200 [Cupriavidus taiwanensis]SOZ48101.1 hypothetical protein CBM2610_B30200 [Cupriavidus taiwanensis]
MGSFRRGQALRRLDRDDGRPQICQQHAAERPGPDAADFDHFDACERAHGVRSFIGQRWVGQARTCVPDCVKTLFVKSYKLTDHVVSKLRKKHDDRRDNLPNRQARPLWLECPSPPVSQRR